MGKDNYEEAFSIEEEIAQLTIYIVYALALLTGLVFHLPVHLVYFILSLEEVVRLVLGVYVFQTRKWMRNII